MKQILLMIGIVALVGCGEKELVQPTTPDTEAPKPESTKAKTSGGEKGREEKTVGLESYLPGKRIVFGLPEGGANGMAQAQNYGCIANMGSLRGAIAQWSLEGRKADDAKVTLDDLAPYLKAGTKGLKCPAGGKYILTTVGENPKCSHGHSLDFERGDKLPPAKGPKPRMFFQFNKDGALQFGVLDENGDVKGNSGMGEATYKVTGPMEVMLTLEDSRLKQKLIFTKPKPGKGDALTLRMPDGKEEFSEAPILEVTPASPLKEKK